MWWHKYNTSKYVQWYTVSNAFQTYWTITKHVLKFKTAHFVSIQLNYCALRTVWMCQFEYWALLWYIFCKLQLKIETALHLKISKNLSPKKLAFPHRWRFWKNLTNSLWPKYLCTASFIYFCKFLKSVQMQVFLAEHYNFFTTLAMWEVHYSFVLINTEHLIRKICAWCPFEA